MTGRCCYCQEEFSIGTKQKKFCSTRCTQKYRWEFRSTKKRICEVCSKKFAPSFKKMKTCFVCSEKIRQTRSKMKRWQIQDIHDDIIKEKLKIRFCEICGKEDNGKDLAFDHDHERKTLRGRLCAKCNTAIGMLGDNLENLKEVIRYLEKYEI